MTQADFWKGKKVAVVGLGPAGEMRADVKFLLGQEALVTAYDMRGKAALRRVISDLKAAGLSDCRTGGVPAEELAAYDLILLSPDMPRASAFLKDARARNVPIEYPDILALKRAPPVSFVGVMGSCGKTAIISMLAGALKRGFKATGMPAPFILDCESSVGSLALLAKAKKDSVVIVRMPDYLLAEYGKARLSPHVAIMAAAPSLLDPFAALAYQTYNNFLITTDEIADRIHDGGDHRSKAKIIRTPASRLPRSWSMAFAEHEREDAALVFEAATLFKVDERFVRASVEDYLGKKSAGTIALVKKVKGVAFYDDSSSEQPIATLAALRSLSAGSFAGDPNGGTILIMGGASTEADYEPLLKTVSQYARAVVLVPGSGTVGIRRELAGFEHLKCLSAPSVESAVKMARAEAGQGDRVLYSPAFAAAGIDSSRALRGERYVKAVRGLW